MSYTWTSNLGTIVAVVDVVVREGVDGWVPLESVVLQARLGARGSADDFRVLAVDVIGYILSDGLMVVGEVRDGDFAGWDKSPEEAVREIRKACMVSGWDPKDSPIHFAITEEGEFRVEEADEAEVQNVPSASCRELD